MIKIYIYSAFCLKILATQLIASSNIAYGHSSEQSKDCHEWEPEKISSSQNYKEQNRWIINGGKWGILENLAKMVGITDDLEKVSVLQYRP